MIHPREEIQRGTFWITAAADATSQRHKPGIVMQCMRKRLFRRVSNTLAFTAYDVVLKQPEILHFSLQGHGSAWIGGHF